MEFMNSYFLLLVLIVPFLFMIKLKDIPFSKDVANKIVLKSKISKKTKFYVLILAYIMFILALSRPIINNGYTTIKAPLENIVIGIDISHNMDKSDFYPNRFEFAKNRVKELLKYLKGEVAIILFDKHSYLISPPTNDYKSIIYLLNHTDIKNLRRSSESDIDEFISSAKNLVKNSKIVAFTSNPNFKENIYYYFISKTKVSTNNVFNASYDNNDLKKLANKLISNKSKEIKIKNKTELFYYPLFIGIILVLFTIFFPIRRIK